MMFVWRKNKTVTTYSNLKSLKTLSFTFAVSSVINRDTKNNNSHVVVIDVLDVVAVGIVVVVLDTD